MSARPSRFAAVTSKLSLSAFVSSAPIVSPVLKSSWKREALGAYAAALELRQEYLPAM
jgi:hypothetical protein